ncbi:MAG: phosphodiester glycosidase family protein [Anaerolineae bacterium]|nr:phosphodiester glycosidase family protein [Anaerolineae bacterium]
MTELLPLIGGLVLLICGALLLRRLRRLSRTGLRRGATGATGVMIAIGCILILTGGILFWYSHRPLPANVRQPLFEGIIYTREVRSNPRPLVIHIVTVDLTAPGIGFLVTPGKPTSGRQLAAQTTSKFRAAHRLQLAINGDFFDPWWSNTPWDYYPHVGDPVDVFGFASSTGTIYATDRSNWTSSTLYIAQDNKAQFNKPDGAVYNAISGNLIFLDQGKFVDRSLLQPYHAELHPRTAVGLTQDGRTLIIVVIDGRQPNYSEGASIADVADVMLKYGAYTGLNLDGGGSSTLVAQGKSGESVVLNSPIDNRIPGRERPVANHLGIYARPVIASKST